LNRQHQQAEELWLELQQQLEELEADLT